MANPSLEKHLLCDKLHKQNYINISTNTKKTSNFIGIRMNYWVIVLCRLTQYMLDKDEINILFLKDMEFASESPLLSICSGGKIYDFISTSSATSSAWESPFFNMTADLGRFISSYLASTDCTSAYDCVSNICSLSEAFPCLTFASASFNALRKIFSTLSIVGASSSASIIRAVTHSEFFSKAKCAAFTLAAVETN
ncbi:hypothetical protein AGLY_012072 [Aphis glycines]|uniref:Uncharacterized protein n=1 Tax=Aphis glycines TaxID=307491 RepID=A0A6G0TAD8_APHGL|nr:hypothetical protein AGLY_012072 [Aphis glycines]